MQTGQVWERRSPPRRCSRQSKALLTLILHGRLGKAFFLEILNRYVPMKVITIRPKNKIWMNSTLYKLSRQKHRFFAAAKRSGTTEAWQAYQRARNQCNIAFKKAKTAFMQRQQDKLTTLADGSSAWWRKAEVLARITTPVEPIPDMTNDGHTVSKQTEKAELLASFFAKQCTAPPANVTDCLNQCPAPYPLPRGQPVFEFPVIRSSTVFHHLSRLSTTKSTADKIITNRVLRECASPITESITYLFNLSIRTSKFPCDWKNAVVTPIFKRRGRESDPSNYRPVSLLPSLGKVLDAIQSEHLLSYLRQDPPLIWVFGHFWLFCTMVWKRLRGIFCENFIKKFEGKVGQMCHRSWSLA